MSGLGTNSRQRLSVLFRIGLVVLAVLAALISTAVSMPPAQAAVTPLTKINFQPYGSTVPAGYVKDVGAGYDSARGFGWVRQDSLDRSVHVPLDLTANTRDRGRAGIDPRQNTLIHLQYGDVQNGTSGSATAGGWEYAVDPGSYQVTVSVGDQPAYDSVHVIRVEGTTAIDHFRSTASAEYQTATVTVPVADGRLTVDAIGGANTKLNYLDLAKVTTDVVAPAAPTRLTAATGDQQVLLTWAANREADLLGYRVYRNGAVVPGPGLVTSPTFTDTSAPNGTSASYQITAIDTSGNESAKSTALASTPAGFAVKVNFSDQATPAPAGYVADYGQAYGVRTASLTYGWSELTDGGPLSLVGNGRNRGTTTDSDVRLATLIHAQLPAGSAGVATPGKWELAVPNGGYQVNVAVGDPGTAVDSVDYVNIEDQNAIAAFVPTTASAAGRHAIATRTVTVTDGRLTLSPAAGTNTKFDYVDVASVPASAAIPIVALSSPVNLATGVAVGSSVVEDLRLPSGGVDAATLTPSTVTLSKVSDGSLVSTNVVTSGGSDTINASPTSPLAANTLYRFDVTSGVHDVEGHSFAPYSVVFTTGSPTGGGGPSFSTVASGAASAQYASVTIGPDGRLYASTLDGYLYRYTINADGTLANQTVIDTVRTHATAAALAGAPNRSIIGLAFDPASTAANLILWISDNQEYVGADVPDYTSKIAKLTGPDLGTYTEILTNLPRSVKDHETNSLAFGPDGGLYFTQGANNAMGAPDSQWGNRPEHRLNAAVLRLDPTKLPAILPVNVKTDDGGTYDPTAANAPLTIYATGVRNAFDLVWHRNGHLYTPTNGSAASGNTPATPNPLPAACATRTDGTYTGPVVPAITSNPQAETDYVFDIKPGRYYGHPNPARCEWVLAGGNPTSGVDLFETTSYPVGTLPDRNLDLADIYDAGLHSSPDGAIEYRGGALDGKLLMVRYSNGQDIQTFDVAADGKLSDRSTGITGFGGFDQPLDLTEDVATDNLYVTELGGQRISLLRPS